jgi:hypothetical protein
MTVNCEYRFSHYWQRKIEDNKVIIVRGRAVLGEIAHHCYKGGNFDIR